MSYQVLARKWRPQDFSSLVGQEPIVTALRNGLRENRIAQAYLFSGIRGVGKTTAARVLAKALNCERGPDPEKPAPDPCNECPPCLDITSGKDMDFLEVDAATYSKVEQVRELTESLRYGTARDRYKVVVLDEVHRLSRQAFDALLKIVEEPPPHLVFIFATTEIDAVPATILSRCQEYQFRRVPSAVLAKHLGRISEAEEIEASDTALRLIARAGEGSVRDSVALLDQLATFGNGSITDQDAKDLLGGFDTAVFLRLLEALIGGRSREISQIVREIEANGWDPHNVFSQFLGFTRDALHLVLDGSPDQVDLPLEEARSLEKIVQPAGYENLLRITQLLLSSEPSVRRSEFGSLALELAWLRAAELPKVLSIEQVLSGGAPPSSTPGPSGGSPPRRSSGSGANIATSPPKAPLQVETRAPEAAATITPVAVAEADRIPKLLRDIGSKRPSLRPLLKRNPLKAEDGRLLVSRSDSQLKSALERASNRQIFDQIVTEIWGREDAWDWYDGQKLSSSREQPAAATEPFQEVRNHPTVKAVLEVFGGSIQSVQPSTKET